MNIEFPYETIRPEQQKFLDAVKNTNKKYIIAQLPTGAGKSGIGIFESMLAENSYLVVTNKALQDQYWRDFKDKFPIKMLKGMNNYDCAITDGVKCDMGPCQGSDSISQGIKRYCKANDLCEYYRTAGAAFKSKIFLANTAIMNAVICRKQIHRELLVIDEAHLLEDFLVDVGSIKLDFPTMKFKFEAEKRLSKQDLEFIQFAELESSTKPTGKMDKFIRICTALIKEVFADLSEYEAEQNKLIRDGKVAEAIEKGGNDSKKKYKYKREIKDAFLKVMEYESSDESHKWVYNWDDKNRSLSIVPLNVDWIFEKFFGNLTDKVIFMSATILNFSNFANTLGLKESECLFIDVPSTFDPKKGPIINIGNCSTSYKALQDPENLEAIAKTVNYIIDQHKGERGIVHTGNMKISKYLKDHCRNSRLLVRYEDVRNEDILEEHNLRSDSVLVSSSMTEGVDLHDDLSTFQIIVKLPWDSLANLRTKTLADEIPMWYQNKMWQKLVQAAGRSVRSHEDYAETFILDASFSFQHNKYSSYLPEYFEKRLINP